MYFYAQAQKQVVVQAPAPWTGSQPYSSLPPPRAHLSTQTEEFLRGKEQGRSSQRELSIFRRTVLQHMLCWNFFLTPACPPHPTETAQVVSVVTLTVLIAAAIDLTEGMRDGTIVIETGYRSRSAASVGKTKSGAGKGNSVDQLILSAE